MMGDGYSFELVERAEQLYCVDGHTFDAVATLTGVATSTLKRWSERYEWQDKKEKIRQAMAAIRTNTILLRAKLIENCLTTLNAQDAFAVSAIEGLAQRAANAAAKGQMAVQPGPDAMREIKTDEDAVEALEEAIQIKLNAMLANPSMVSLAAVKDIKTVSDYVAGMRAKAAGKAVAETGMPGTGGPTEEDGDESRRKLVEEVDRILGVTR